MIRVIHFFQVLQCDFLNFEFQNYNYLKLHSKFFQNLIIINLILNSKKIVFNISIIINIF